MNYNYLNQKNAQGLNAFVAAQNRTVRRVPLSAVVNPLTRSASTKATVGSITNSQSAFWEIATAASVGLSAYHGYKRNDDSLGWGLAWGALGGLFPIITPAVAFAEGFAERKR